jgi:hypothetical protein
MTDKFFKIEVIISIPDYELCDEHQHVQITGLDYITIGEDCQLHEISETEMVLVEKEAAIFQQEVLKSIDQITNNKEEGK